MKCGLDKSFRLWNEAWDGEAFEIQPKDDFSVEISYVGEHGVIDRVSIPYDMVPLITKAMNEVAAEIKERLDV